MPGASGCPAVGVGILRRRHQRAAEHAFDGFARQAAGPQQHRRVKTADNGGFDADRDRPAVDDQVDSPGEVALHMGRRGRRNMARQIGRWRHHRPAEGAQDGQAPPGGRAPGSRRCRARRWRARPPRNRPISGTTSVSGPGQNALASAVARASKRPICRALARSPTWAISGLKAGRPLAW